MSPEDTFASQQFDDDFEDDHEAQLEHAFSEIAALNKALLEAETERDALREALQALVKSLGPCVLVPVAVRDAYDHARTALEPRPPAGTHACDGPIDCLECGGTGKEGAL